MLFVHCCHACRSTILQSLRGKLLASTFSPSHYNRLKDIGLSTQEKEAEIATIQRAIDDAKREATDIKPGHAHNIVVSLTRDTFATITLMKPRNSHEQAIVIVLLIYM